jgi:hypothetical protein
MQPSQSNPPSRVNKLFTLGASIVVAAVLVALIIPIVGSFDNPGNLPRSLNGGHQIYMALRNYAEEAGHGGGFPTFADYKEGRPPFENSNEALQVLLPNYIDDLRVFDNKESAWCRPTVKPPAVANVIHPGFSDWCYVRGLRRDSPPQWPLLANAFAPGTTHYVKDPSKPGGVWKGIRAVVVHAGGSAKIVETKPSSEFFFVPRQDKPQANAFEADGEWLAGEHVKVLLPILPQGAAQ